MVYKVKVYSKHVSSGKGRTYYLDLEPWGNFITTNKMRVKKNLYDEINDGDMVQVNYQKGLFNIPWYYMPKNKIFD